jgi:hypothetical protein
MNQPCPICKVDDFTTLFDRQLRNRIFDLNVYCPMEAQGCKWQGKYEDIKLHLNVGEVEGECQYILVACPFGCEESFLRRKLRKHMARGCPKRHNQCNVCHGCASSSGSHTPDCPNRTVECPNGCPIPYIKFCKLDEHVAELCPYREVECKFFQFGCRSVFKFRDGPRHYVDKTPDHLELLRVFAANQTGLDEGYMLLVQRNSALEAEHQTLKEKVVVLESRCEQYESSIVELHEAVQSLRVSQGRPLSAAPRVRDTWVGFSDYHDSAHLRPPAPLPPRDGVTETDEDPFCFRP